MILGCDVGTGFTKAVTMENGSIDHYVIIPTEADPDGAIEKILSDIRKNKGLKQDDLEEIVITGWGEPKVSLNHTSRPLLNCIGKAAARQSPSCRTVLSMGCQNTLVLTINDQGRVMEYRTNDKCAAGSGRFIEVISGALEVSVEDSSDIARAADKELTMSSQCAVFAESEVVSRVNDGESVANIMAALLASLSRSVAVLMKRINAKKDCIVAGGLANNQTLLNYIQDSVKMELQLFQPRPELIGAVGAALSAKGGN